MQVDLYRLLNENLTLTVFAVIALGYLLARIKIAGIELGSTTGVLLAGLILGHFGLTIHELVGTFGFILFIFTIGLQAGPSFFSVVAKDGAKYFSMAVVVTVTAFSLVYAITLIFDLNAGYQAGILGGALTSTPTIAGAQDAVKSGLVSLSAGSSATEIISRINVGYAVTYVFGSIGIIFLIRLIPTMLGINLPQEASRLSHESGLSGRSSINGMGKQFPVIRAYKIPAGDLVGMKIEQAVLAVDKRVLPLRVRRGDQVMDADPALEIHEGDVISVIGELSDHMKRGADIGPEILDPDLLNYQIVSKEIVVINADVVGKTLKELELLSHYGCIAHAIVRASIEIPVNERLNLNKGDRICVMGEEKHIAKLADRLGRIESEMTHTDLLTLSIGLGVGLLLGMITIKFGWFSFAIGSAAGLLLTGILIGFLRAQHPTFGGVPPAARLVLSELGLAFFMASIGVNAGAHLFDVMRTVGPQLILIGIVVTFVPTFVGYVFGRKFLKLNPVLLLGSLTGAMTSTPSLNVIIAGAKSDIPVLGYAGTYTFANVFLTLAGSLIMII